MDSWKIRDAADQSSSWIEQIPGKDRIATEQKQSWSRVNMWKGEKNSFTFFNMFFPTKMEAKPFVLFVKCK